MKLPMLLAALLVVQAPQANEIEEAQEQLQSTFKNLQFSSFKPGPIDGLFEINAGGQIIYFHPQKELLFMGEVFNKEGQSLTAQSLEADANALESKLPVDKSIKIVKEGAITELIEFTDPECGYCKSFERFMQKEGGLINRTVFFDTRGSESSRQKVVHILCSSDREKAMQDIYMGIKPSKYLDCPEGREMQKVHAEATRLAGVRGTPSFIINGKLTLGFRPEIKKYVKGDKL
ncbi:DsbC family protein [Pseudoalteromonas luteoviolacea]|uniref:DsbC family protein n=1 Tax=Pseudoalteromonas luteoviolacea TaxID=43657 RepID=UPI001FFDAC57|nr:DsbC family protein [Pseudoalteromonas luteoviolacea]